MKKYHSIKELMEMAEEAQVSPGIIACKLEAELSNRSYEDVWQQMDQTIPVFMKSIRHGLGDKKKSSSGLVGGDARRLYNKEPLLLGRLAKRAAAYAVATAEANAIDLLGGTTEQMKNAIALALKNLLGLACDPVAGLVEVPCVKRNGFEAVHTLVAVEMAMAGIQSQIPVDEVIQAMDEIGKLMPASIRETSLAGLAMTETGQKIAQQMSENHK